MPTANERIENKGLDGQELKQILIADFTKMLDRDAMFAKRLLYERAAYRLKYQLFLQNPSYPEHVNQTTSAPPPKGGKPEPARKSIDAPDNMKQDGKTVKVGKEVNRVIDSPNLARIENDMPLMVAHKDLETGRMVESPVKYQGEGSAADHPELNQKTERDTKDEEWK